MAELGEGDEILTLSSDFEKRTECRFGGEGSVS
jgi:hypothetical protein